MALDGQVEPKSQRELPPFVRFDRFLAELQFNQGEHVTIVGPTGSGKTVLAMQLLAFRDYCVAMGTKRDDRELYGELRRRGFEFTTEFEPEPEDGETHVIFRPPLRAPTADAIAAQREAFRMCLTEVYLAGGWAVYTDELPYMIDNLKLTTEYETLLLQGRSAGITLLSATQEPVGVPLAFFGMATHLFLFVNPDRQRVQRMAEFTGQFRPVAEYTIPRLPDYEFLYVNTRRRQIVRSKVIRNQ